MQLRARCFLRQIDELERCAWDRRRPWGDGFITHAVDHDIAFRRELDEGDRFAVRAELASESVEDWHVGVALKEGGFVLREDDRLTSDNDRANRERVIDRVNAPEGQIETELRTIHDFDELRVGYGGTVHELADGDGADGIRRRAGVVNIDRE